MSLDSGPPSVSRYEYTLLRILRYIFGAMPADQAKQLVATEYSPAPPCLTRTCVELAQETLAKGMILYLVRAGGWRRDRYLDAGEPKRGRTWERIPLNARVLEFGPHPLEFLMWLTAEKPTATKKQWDVPPSELTPADELFFALALDALEPCDGSANVLVRRAVMMRNPFCWLFSPKLFWEVGPEHAPDFATCFTGVRAVMLECLQRRLGERWARSERSKGQIADWRVMRGTGAVEAATLRNYLQAAETAGRYDLARFVLQAASATLGGRADLTTAFWTGGLQSGPPQRLADKIETQRFALALPAQLETLNRWDRRAQSVGYFDDGYAASQLWKADWDAADGPNLARRAGDLLASLDPLHT